MKFAWALLLVLSGSPVSAAPLHICTSGFYCGALQPRNAVVAGWSVIGTEGDTGISTPAAPANQLPQKPADAPVPSAELQQDRARLTRILLDGNFPAPSPPSLWERMRDALFTWLERQLAKLSGYGSSTPWASRLLMIGFVAAACLGLLLWFRQLARKQRIPLRTQAGKINQQLPSAQDWQIWLEQARQLAREQRWREGIHRIYWAAISQMESRGAWRPDPTRTPREYLNLLDRQSAKRSDLARLTSAFEQFWYGNRPAAEQDYAQACTLMERLAAG